MTHEPECDAATLSVKGHEFNLPCICEVASAAYQRGREEAAQQVHTELLAQFRGVEHAGHRAVVAAARGDWHMKSIKYYYNVHMPECEDKHCGGCIPANPEDLK